MSDDNSLNSELVKLVGSYAVSSGFTPSSLPGVQFVRSDFPIPRHPVVYNPSIVIIVQGYKVGYLSDLVFRYDASHYLVLSVPLPFECETSGTPDKPLLGIVIDIDVTLVGELILEMDEHYVPTTEIPQSIHSVAIDNELLNATVRLMKSLGNKQDGRILGQQTVREIVYRVLCGEQGSVLRALAVRNGRFSQIAKVLKRIHTEYDSGLDIESLANDANMSVSTFHSNFKAVTSASPLQYIKSIRLHKAKTLMLQEGMSAGIAARSVGYESVSQFSREYKRYFGCTPTSSSIEMRSVVGPSH